MKFIQSMGTNSDVVKLKQKITKERKKMARPISETDTFRDQNLSFDEDHIYNSDNSQSNSDDGEDHPTLASHQKQKKKRGKPLKPRNKDVTSNLIKSWEKRSKMTQKLQLDMTLKKKTIHKTYLIYIILKGKRLLSQNELLLLEKEFLIIIQKGIKSQQKKQRKGQRVEFHKKNIACFQNVRNLISTLLRNSIDRVALRIILSEEFLEHVNIGECQGKNGVMTAQNQKVQTSQDILVSVCHLQEQFNLEENQLQTNLEENQLQTNKLPAIPLTEQQEPYFPMNLSITEFALQIDYEQEPEMFEFDELSAQTQENIISCGQMLRLRNIHLI